jgi:type III pantothenate kinase
MGMDRLAAVIGAYDLKPNNDILIIDAGTAITFDILNSFGEYLGGNISPGLEMRFKALHEYTSLLPLVSDYSVKSEVGVDTISAIQNGVINGVKYEIKGVIESFVSKYPQLLIFLTGGNDFDFDTRIKKRIFVDKYLVLRGLNRVLKELII